MPQMLVKVSSGAKCREYAGCVARIPSCHFLLDDFSDPFFVGPSRRGGKHDCRHSHQDR